VEITDSFGQNVNLALDNNHRLSSAKEFKLFPFDRKSFVNILTIAVFSLGVTAALLFVYQQSTPSSFPNFESKEEAIAVAVNAGSWNEETIRDKKIEVTLVHVKANGFSFIVDQDTLQDSLTLYHNQYPSYENYYLWIVSIIAPNNRDWVYTIDVATGEIITPS